jgi:DNA-directed RNA polymerase subunit H (RpoH/RPB5)
MEHYVEVLKGLFKYRLESVGWGDMQEAKHYCYLPGEYLCPRTQKHTSVHVIWVPQDCTLGSDYAQTFKKHQPHHLIIVRDKESKGAHEILWKSHHYIEYLYYSDLLFNKMEYGLVPKYRIIYQPTEKDQLLQQLHTDIKNLPKMLHRDAIGRLLGVRPGDIVEVTVPNLLMGTHIFYRLVELQT